MEMTVQDLINELNKIEDKSMFVFTFDGDAMLAMPKTVRIDPGVPQHGLDPYCEIETTGNID